MFHNGQKVLETPRFEITHGAMSGMLMNKNFENSYQAIDAVLSDVQPRSAQFIALDPMFSVWNGRYLSIDANYATWTWAVIDSTKVIPQTEYKRIFISSSPEFIEDYSKALNLVVKGMPISYTLSGFSTATFAELVRPRN
jgi:hypothetical protein